MACTLKGGDCLSDFPKERGIEAKIQLERGECYINIRDYNGNSGSCTVAGTTN